MKKQMQRRTSNTCLAVVREETKGNKRGKLIFAADRRISWGHMKYQVAVRPKVVNRGGIVLAGTGASYICDLLCELMDVPSVPEHLDGYTYMHSIFFQSAIKALTSKGLCDENGKLKTTESLTAVILVGCKGDLFEVTLDSESGGDSLLTIDPIDVEYAHGCGGYYALGSLSSTKGEDLKSLQKKLRVRGIKHPPKKLEECRLSLAIIVAAEHSGGCDGNVDIVYEG